MHHLRKTLLVAVLLAVGGFAHAQDYYGDEYYEPDYAYEFSPRTGDAALDTLLQALNILYRDDRNAYVEDIVYSTGAPRGYIENLIVQQHYPPADVYLMAQTASLTGRPIDYVQREFDTNRGQGWGVVAQRLGIKPGSAEFHRLKSGAGAWSTRANAKVKQKKVKNSRSVITGTRVIRTKAESRPDNGTVQTQSPGKGHGQDHGKSNSKDHGKSNGKGQGKNKDKNKGS